MQLVFIQHAAIAFDSDLLLFRFLLLHHLPLSGAPFILGGQGRPRPGINRGSSMVSAFGPVQMIGDIADALEVTCPTIRAAFHATVGGKSAFERLCQITLEPLLGDATIQMIPGKGLTKQATAEIKIGLNVVGVKSLLPQVESELLCPAVKPTAELIGSQQRSAQATVAPSENTFKKGQPRVVPFELNPVTSQFAP